MECVTVYIQVSNHCATITITNFRQTNSRHWNFLPRLLCS